MFLDNKNLTELTSALYTIFRSPLHLSWIAEMDDPSDIAFRKKIKSEQLQSLTVDDLTIILQGYCWDEKSFKHFLPRMLEAMHRELPAIADKLLKFEYTKWPSEQNSAVSDFIMGLALSTRNEEVIEQAARLELASNKLRVKPIATMTAIPPNVVSSFNECERLRSKLREAREIRRKNFELRFLAGDEEKALQVQVFNTEKNLVRLALQLI